MFKFIVVILLVIIVVSLNNISISQSMSAKEKQAVLETKERQIRDRIEIAKLREIEIKEQDEKDKSLYEKSFSKINSSEEKQQWIMHHGFKYIAFIMIGFIVTVVIGKFRKMSD